MKDFPRDYDNISKYTSASISILVKQEWQINSGLHLKSKKSNELKRLYSNKWWNGIKIKWKFLCIYSTNVGTYKNNRLQNHVLIVKIDKFAVSNLWWAFPLPGLLRTLGSGILIIYLIICCKCPFHIEVCNNTNDRFSHLLLDWRFISQWIIAINLAGDFNYCPRKTFNSGCPLNI